MIQIDGESAHSAQEPAKSAPPARVGFQRPILSESAPPTSAPMGKPMENMSNVAFTSTSGAPNASSITGMAGRYMSMAIQMTVVHRPAINVSSVGDIRLCVV